MKSHAGIDAALSRAAEAKEVPGVVAMAATDNGVIYEGAFGLRDLAAAPAMTLDAVFRIASMTKAVTSVAAMQLVEQGELELDDPIGKVLPTFAAPPLSWRVSMRPARHDCAQPSARSPCATC
jgi:methyl acetate hydrolase